MCYGWKAASAAWQKLMAAYYRVYGFSHVQADCRVLRSVPEPYARSASSLQLPLTFYLFLSLPFNGHFFQLDLVSWIYWN